MNGSARTMRVMHWAGWLAGLTVTILALFAFRDRLDKAHVALSFLLLVLGASAIEGRRLGIALAAAAFLAFNWFFLKPYNTLVIADPLDWLVLAAFLGTGIFAANLL